MKKKILVIILIGFALKSYSQDTSKAKSSSYKKWVKAINIQAKVCMKECTIRHDKFCKTLIKNIIAATDDTVRHELSPRASFSKAKLGNLQPLNTNCNCLVIEYYNSGDRNHISFFIVKIGGNGSISHYRINNGWQLLSVKDTNTLEFDKQFLSSKKSRKNRNYIDYDKIIVTKFSQGSIAVNLSASIYNEDLNKWKLLLQRYLKTFK
jgi:hypothetical protein